jgi:glycosyltransferase involved in cell wall biosynthesis
MQKLKIAFDARPLNGDPQGIGIYLIKLAERLLSQDHEVVFISNQNSISWEPEDKKNFSFFWSPVKEIKPGDDFLNKFVWEEVELKKILEKIRPDIYHAISNKGIPETNVPSVLTVHDVIPLYFPKSHEYYCYRMLVYGLAVKRAQKIITISQFSEEDLIKNFPLAKGKTKVIHNGTNHLNVNSKNPYSENTPYIVYNGGFGPRKNIDSLILAFEKIVKEEEFKDYKLLLMGEKTDSFEKIYNLVSEKKLNEKVIFTGYVSKDNLGSIIKDGFCSIYPSFYEGFGFPPIESMSVGCPVITADNSSLPEVVGDAGLYFDAKKPDEIVKQFLVLAKNDKLRLELIQKGYRNIERFSWEKNCTEVLDVYKYILTKRK